VRNLPKMVALGDGMAVEWQGVRRVWLTGLAPSEQRCLYRHLWPYSELLSLIWEDFQGEQDEEVPS